MGGNLKEDAGVSAASLVKDGSVIGIGTGSTTFYAIQEIARRIKEEGIEIKAVPTSVETAHLAARLKIPLTNFDEYQELDIAIDGADQVDKHLNLIKGGGSAHLREKIVAVAAKRFIVVADEGKILENLNMPVPLEVVPFASGLVIKAIKEMGGNAMYRVLKGKAGPVVSDNCNFIIDADFGLIEDPASLEKELNSITGIVDNGIFSGLTSEVHIGTEKGVKIIKKE